MSKVEEKVDIASVELTDDFAAMADYVRSPEGRTAIERGLSDLREGRTFEGPDALKIELDRREKASGEVQ